ncbi:MULTISPECIES: DUF2200 domain-containing protein [Amylolactobacillus]|nr:MULTISPECIES: DUF2200 domain-containing protein [Amylolactobacillus]APT18809.1 hypothetical protein LA20533_05845 [Amylolactobacillus amylophilus DSM 20533 = JCM 1125]GED80842.1 hypothetical protein LAM01_13150 [Amylolactobacillus amylophilus]
MAHPKLFEMSFTQIYEMYVQKVERKDKSKAELDQVLSWLTGYDEHKLDDLVASDIMLGDFVDQAKFNENATLITGMICGVRVEEITEPRMQKIRYMDKLVDELARGKKMTSILRQ